MVGGQRFRDQGSEAKLQCQSCHVSVLLLGFGVLNPEP